MTDLRFMRAWRIFVVAALVFNVVMLVVDAATGNPVVVLPITCVTGLAWATVLMTKTIRTRTKQLRPRPDYAAIARMERDIFGEAFEQDGAPQTPRPQRQTCGYGHPRASDGACRVCEYHHHYRLDGPLPADMIRSTVHRDWGRDDDAFIRSGAILHPRATVILPSGEKIDSAEWARRGGRTS